MLNEKRYISRSYGQKMRRQRMKGESRGIQMRREEEGVMRRERRRGRRGDDENEMREREEREKERDIKTKTRFKKRERHTG